MQTQPQPSIPRSIQQARSGSGHGNQVTIANTEWLGSFSTEERELLVAHVQKWNLVCDQILGCEAVISRNGNGTSQIVTKWSGVERVLIRSGLYRPGKTDLRYTDNGPIAYAECYYREREPGQSSANDHSETWLTTSATAAYQTYAVRDFSRNFPELVPTGEWAIIPEILLASTAQYLAAERIFYDFIRENFVCSPQMPMAYIHADVTASRPQK